MTIWTVPTHLPDLRRVDATRRDRHRDERRGPARRSRLGLAVARRLCLRHQRRLARRRRDSRASISRCAIPTARTSIRDNVARWLKDLIAAGVNFITQNGLYDWGWLRADLGVAMPPSDQLEEIGALATLIDENRFNYSLDALCDWRGLPGKDTALLEEAVKAAGFKISKKNPLQSYIWQMPAHYVGPYAEADPIATLSYLRTSNPILDQRGHPRRLSARSRPAADGA